MAKDREYEGSRDLVSKMIDKKEQMEYAYKLQNRLCELKNELCSLPWWAIIEKYRIERELHIVAKTYCKVMEEEQ